jgi:hypothetical protein
MALLPASPGPCTLFCMKDSVCLIVLLLHSKTCHCLCSLLNWCRLCKMIHMCLFLLHKYVGSGPRDEVGKSTLPGVCPLLQPDM